MKKLVITISTALLFFANAVTADVAMGITANFASIDTSGTEKLRDSGKLSTASHTEDTVVPELFIEVTGDRGAFGLAYIPVQEMGAKSRSDTKDANGGASEDTGTYKAEAEIDSHVMIYADINMTEFAGQQVYAKLGVSNAEITTLEDLNGGSSYDNQDVMGYTLGLGLRGDVPMVDNTFFKLEGTYTDYEDYESNNANNNITAETEITSVKLSVGYNF